MGGVCRDKDSERAEWHEEHRRNDGLDEDRLVRACHQGAQTCSNLLNAAHVPALATRDDPMWRLATYRL